MRRTPANADGLSQIRVSASILGVWYAERVAQSELEVILTALESARVDYLVVGGVAVVLHGHPRFTADLDLVIHLQPSNITAALHALEELDYRPRAPVVATEFADAEKRRSWIESKGMTVFSMWSPTMPATEVDIFVQEPFVFAEAWQRALRADLGDFQVWVASIDDLIALKRSSGRAKDMEDIRVLEQLKQAGIAEGDE